MKLCFLILLHIFTAFANHGTPLRNHTNRHAFFRNMGDHQPKNTRRIFGGSRVDIKDFPFTCLLTSKDKSPQCTGSWIHLYFVLTAAHCITPDLYYVFYNARVPRKGNFSKVFRAYKHPEYEVFLADEGQGLDVVQLHHDVGLVQTETPLIIAYRGGVSNPLAALRTLPEDLTGEQVDVVGFGRTESSPSGEELLGAKLLVWTCGRPSPSWMHCTCGVTAPGQRTMGVCTGDSGGPMLLNGVQVGITSMGPMECMTSDVPWLEATSVFTKVSNYVDLINDTMTQSLTNQLSALYEKPIKRTFEKTMKEVKLDSKGSSFKHTFQVFKNYFTVFVLIYFIL